MKELIDFINSEKSILFTIILLDGMEMFILASLLFFNRLIVMQALTWFEDSSSSKS